MAAATIPVMRARASPVPRINRITRINHANTPTYRAKRDEWGIDMAAGGPSGSRLEANLAHLGPAGAGQLLIHDRRNS
jgi:hypothetical protein